MLSLWLVSVGVESVQVVSAQAVSAQVAWVQAAGVQVASVHVAWTHLQAPEDAGGVGYAGKDTNTSRRTNEGMGQGGPGQGFRSRRESR
jgi:hypothetical protein